MEQETAERRLDMGGGASEAIVKIKMAEGGVQIVAPKQADDPAAQPYTFRIARGTIYGLLSLGKFIDFLCLFLTVGGRGLVGRLGIIALGESGRDEDRGRSTQCDRYAEHTMEHGSLKFFWAVYDDETGVSWLWSLFRYGYADSPHSRRENSPSPSVCPAHKTAQNTSAWHGVVPPLMPQTCRNHLTNMRSRSRWDFLCSWHWPSAQPGGGSVPR